MCDIFRQQLTKPNHAINMYTIVPVSSCLVWIVLLALLHIGQTRAVHSCEQAQLNCAFRSDCGPSLQAFQAQCGYLMVGIDANATTPPQTGTGAAAAPISECSNGCAQALFALSSSENGAELLQCDCGGSRYCELSRQRLEVCRSQVQPLLQPDVVLECSLAHLMCESQLQCNTALDYFVRHCRAAISGRMCSRRCANSLSILARQPHAAKLARCRCDGNERFPCVSIKHNLRTLCGLNETDLTIQPIKSILQINYPYVSQHPFKQHLHHRHFSNHHRSSYHHQHPQQKNMQADYGNSLLSNSIIEQPLPTSWQQSAYSRLSSTLYLDLPPEAQQLSSGASTSVPTAVKTAALVVLTSLLHSLLIDPRFSILS